MLKLSCLCGQVRIEIAEPPDFINECNCTLCSKSGARWAYFHPSDVRVEGRTKGYSRDDKDDPAAEIHFFKNVKPPFMAELFYYVKIYQLHARWPVGSAQLRQDYLQRALRQAQQFYEDNLDFYLYYRTDSTDLDMQYFIRAGQPPYRHLPGSIYSYADSFSTGYDLMVSTILAYDRLQEYLKDLLASPDSGLRLHMAALESTSTVLWTGEKVDLVQLGYALAETGCCNNGKANVRDIIAALEIAFNTDLRYYARYMIDIRRRKSDKPSFIDTLIAAYKRYLGRQRE